MYKIYLFLNDFGKYIEDNTTDKKAPGPGTYNIIESINRKGQFPISKYKALGVKLVLTNLNLYIRQMFLIH